MKVKRKTTDELYENWELNVIYRKIVTHVVGASFQWNGSVKTHLFKSEINRHFRQVRYKETEGWGA